MKCNLRIIYIITFTLLLLTEIMIALFINDRFIRPYVGDILVTVLICCLIRIVSPTGLQGLPCYVFLFSAAVELGQYFDIVKLLELEDNRIISTLIGRTFSFPDLLCYAVGCVLFAGFQSMLTKYCSTR